MKSTLNSVISFSGAIILAGAVGACASSVNSAPDAWVDLQPTKGNQVSGKVEFHKEGSMVRITGVVNGLLANREHGFHIHEKGDCSSGDGLSAGGHFNPGGAMHGEHGKTVEHHAGDLPSLKANAFGTARFDFVTSRISLQEGALDVRKTALIVHADPDDFKTQPTGNSGKRVACGVVSAM